MHKINTLKKEFIFTKKDILVNNRILDFNTLKNL